MKKFILFLFITINASLMNAQKYTPFNFENGIWKDHSFTPNNGNFINDYFTYYTNSEDTIINNIKYFKLFCFYVETHALYPPTTSSTFYSGLIRNDTLNRLVKVIWYKDSVEKNLYDFNHITGDTLYSILHQPARISSIDSIEICGIYHKRFTLKDYFSDSKYADSSKLCLIENIPNKKLTGQS